MATYRLLATRATLFHNIFVPVRPVAAALSIRRDYNTHSSVDKDSNGSMDEELLDRRGARKIWHKTEDNKFLILMFEMPGLDKDNVKVTREHDILYFNGELEEAKRPSTGYCGSFQLPAHMFNLTQIKAEMKDGLLTVRVPKLTMEESMRMRFSTIEVE